MQALNSHDVFCSLLQSNKYLANRLECYGCFAIVYKCRIILLIFKALGINQIASNSIISHTIVTWNRTIVKKMV